MYDTLCINCIYGSIEDPWNDFYDLVAYCNRSNEDGIIKHEYKGPKEIAPREFCKFYVDKN